MAAWLLSRAGNSLNTRSALLHVLSDMLGSVAAIVAGAVIVATGWTPIDPILSLCVSLLIVRSTWSLLAQSTGVLMEGVPAHLDYERVGRALLRVPGVAAVHDLHVWQMTSDRAALSAHVLIARADAVAANARRRAARCSPSEFHIDHVTLQPTWHQPPPGKRIIPVMPVGSGESSGLH